MSDIKVRNLNSFGFPGGFNITNNEPIDSRTKVIDITHIYEEENWKDVKPYAGLIVTDEHGNSYICINSSQDIDQETGKPEYCSESSWIPSGKLSYQYSPEISYSKLIGLSAYGAFTMYTELVNARNNADDRIIASYQAADRAIIDAYTNADDKIIGSYQAADTAIINAYTNADDKIIGSYQAADTAIIKSYEAADTAIIKSYEVADAAIIGKDTDADTALTIYGVRKYAVTNCTNLQNTINNKLSWCAVTKSKNSTTTAIPTNTTTATNTEEPI